MAQSSAGISFSLPNSYDAWLARKAEIQAILEQLLGETPPERTPEVEILSRTVREGCLCEHFRFHNGDTLTGSMAWVTGYLLIPEHLTGPAPAIQYYHWHAGDYPLGKEQLWTLNSRGLTPAYEMTSRGYVVLAIDAYGFGERYAEGTGERAKAGLSDEMALSKLNLWYGRTLWGMQLRDERLALDYLCTRPEIDPQRIAAMGISMGSTRTWWRMALDGRIRAGVAVACLTRYQELIAHTGLHKHGIYYFVPGVLRHFDSEAIVSLCAPRALFCLTGDQDGGSPADGVRAITAAVEKVYALEGVPERFRSLLYAGVGHEWTPEMWEETFTWLERWL